MQCQCCATQEYWINFFNKVSLCHMSVTGSLDCHWQYEGSSKVIHWQRSRIVRVPPLKIFGEPLDQSEARILSSRPIRGLDFREILGISQIFIVSLECHWTNSLQIYCKICRWSANLSMICDLNHCHMYKYIVNGLPLKLKLTLPIEWDCRWTVTWMSLECHST